MQLGAHRATVLHFKVFHQCLLQGEMPKNVPGGRAQYLSQCLEIQDALDIDIDHAHVVTCVVLRHPDELPDIYLWRIPVDRLGDMRMPTPDGSSKLQFLNIANQRP